MDDRNNVYERICAWCDKPLEPRFVHQVPDGTVIACSRGEGSILITHGICAACKREQLVQLSHSMRTHEQSPERLVQVLREHDLEATKKWGGSLTDAMHGRPAENAAMAEALACNKRQARRIRVLVWIVLAAALAAATALL